MATHLSEHPNRLAIVPSMLEVDFARLSEEVAALEKAGADRLQWDLMDGRFRAQADPWPGHCEGHPGLRRSALRGPHHGGDDGDHRAAPGRFHPADKSRRVYFDQAWASMPPVFPAASGGIHVWHMPELVAIFGDEAVFQFGDTQGHPQGNAAGATRGAEVVEGNQVEFEEVDRLDPFHIGS